MSVSVEPAGSDGTRSLLVIGIHGFYLEDKQGPDGTAYVRPFVPGMGHVGQLGAPDLPALALDLALPPGITGVQLTQFNVQQGASFPGLNVWPKAIPALDDTVGVPEQFVKDPAIYSSERPWPTANADGTVPARAALATIRGARVHVYPFRWSPLGRTLQVASQVVVQFDHDGTPAAAPDLITRRRGRVAASRFANWGVVSGYYPINPNYYEGQYLVVMPQSYDGALQPLLEQKAARGFHTQVRYIPEMGSTCASIRALIQDWYAHTPANQDHYCLLVGEPATIPLCDAPIDGAPPTDDLYASVDGDDLDTEVYVGRLSAKSGLFASTMVGKILRYMDNPPQSNAFQDVLLVANKEGAPGKYVGAHESVRLASYSSPPNFLWIYGNQPLQSNSDISNIINAGVGLVAYRGHGSATSWAAWNVPDSSYTVNNVVALADNPIYPVVWSFACSNHDLNENSCLGEWWLYRSRGGAVSSYGATVASDTGQNHELDRQMFKAVYDLGLTTQSQAIQYAETQMGLLVGSSNAWLYNLLGDPEMPIRRSRPEVQWQVLKPAFLEAGSSPGSSVNVRVLDSGTGSPVPNAQVSLWKPGTVDEVFDNRYTDGTGNANVPAAPQTTGWVYLTVQDDLGNSTLDSIQVVSPVSVPSIAAPALRFAAVPSVARGETVLGFSTPLAGGATITVFDVRGRAVRRFDLREGEASVRWTLQDWSGAPVAPGLYLAQARGVQGAVATARVVVLR